MREGLPDTTVLRYRGAFDLEDTLAAKIAEETEAELVEVRGHTFILFKRKQKNR